MLLIAGEYWISWCQPGLSVISDRYAAVALVERLLRGKRLATAE